MNKQNRRDFVKNSALAATMPSDASKLYGKNVLNFLQLIIDKEGNLNLNWQDDLVKGCHIFQWDLVVAVNLNSAFDDLLHQVNQVVSE